MTSAPTRESAPRWVPDRQLDGRNTRGLTVSEGRLRGLRTRCSVDQLVEALAAIGWSAERDPIEDGPPPGLGVGVLQTWGSPWLDVVERDPPGLLDPGLAARLSELGGVDVLYYDYDFAGGSLEHALCRAGVVVEQLDHPGPLTATVLDAVTESYRSWQMRDWGLSFQRLSDLELPCSPQLIVEAYFLRLVKL